MSLTKSVSIHVNAQPDRAFQVFTDRMTEWWPLQKGYTHGGDRAAEIHLEGRPGGRLYERFADGEEYEVGRVTAFDPPRRVVFTWTSPSWQAPTEVDVRFTPDGRGTRVDLEHRGWESIGPIGPEDSASYGTGWQEVLGAYAAMAEREAAA
jgi:uncharacterized protein YndB with AHSA1/START domain